MSVNAVKSTAASATVAAPSYNKKSALQSARKNLSQAKGLAKFGGYLSIVMPPIGGLVTGLAATKTQTAKKILDELKSSDPDNPIRNDAMRKISTGTALALTSVGTGLGTIGAIAGATALPPIAVVAVAAWLATPGAAFAAYSNIKEAAGLVDTLTKDAKK